MSITIRYGSGNSLTKDFPAGTTLGCILGNQHVKAALGYGNNVAGHIGGVPQSGSLVPPDGATVSVNDVACEKN